MTLTWIIDKHVDKVRKVETPFVDIAQQRGHIVYCLRDSLIPQKIDVSNIKISGSTIIRGSHGFVNYIHQELNATPGGFLHPTNFQLSTYAPIIGNLCLNEKYKIVTYKNFIDNRSQYKGEIFVKPLSEMKKFTGIVLKDNESLEEVHTNKFKKWFIPEDNCELIVSPALKIFNEYRIVVINGNPITGSLYSETGTSNDVPAEIFNTVKEVANIWNPMDVYVIDIAQTNKGNKIIEYNQFSTSAMYSCDQEKIIIELEKLS